MGDKLTGKVNMLRKTVGAIGVDNMRSQFLKLQEKQMRKWVKKKKYSKIDKEKQEWLESPSFMKFWKETLGLSEDMLDSIFKYEAVK